MSVENVKAFYLRMASDKRFRDRIQTVKNSKERIQILKASGFEFTSKEFEKYTAGLIQLNKILRDLKEVEEKELETVAGGLALPTSHIATLINKFKQKN